MDTAAFLAILNRQDEFHPAASQLWGELVLSGGALYTSNYILVETAALLQRRFGMEAVRVFQAEILPAVEILWVDEALHAQATSALLAANRRSLSLVDCTSFELMRQAHLETAFTFDEHFRQQGFATLPTA